MSCNRLSAILTSSLNSNLATSSLSSGYNNLFNPKFDYNSLFCTGPTSSFQASLTSSLQASYFALVTSLIDTESKYPTYLLTAELSSSLDMCYFNPPLS